MRAVLQRVTQGKVTIAGRIVGEIKAGLVILLGVGAQDTEVEVDLLANKIANLRVFAQSSPHNGYLTASLPHCKSSLRRRDAWAAMQQA